MTGSDPDLENYRLRVRAWLAENAPPFGWTDGAPRGGADEAIHTPQAVLASARACQRALFNAGYAGISWPIEYGGQGLSNREQVVFNQESSGYLLPVRPFAIGLGMCGPTLLASGTRTQKERHIRPMLQGAEIWCQLFSEPDAGSDVAGIRCRADLQNDGTWLVNGQKVWTSGAHISDFGLLLVRTDRNSARHAGLSMLVVDMHAPGVTIRPLRQMNGASGFTEVFFDDVSLPADAVVGEVGQGWRTALITLMNERVAIGAGRQGDTAPDAAQMAREARGQGFSPGSVVADAVADLYVHEQVLTRLSESINESILAGRTPGPQGSIAKLTSNDVTKRAVALTLRLAGPAGQAWPAGDVAGDERAMILLSLPGRSIAGGTDEIMRNIIGERVLGLPREPRPQPRS